MKKALRIQKNIIFVASTNKAGVQPGKGHENKMNFQTIETSSNVASTGLYEQTVFKIKNTTVCVTKFTTFCSVPDYINVTVCNASNRAFRGFGKQFRNIDEALNHYSNKNIQAILNTYK